MASLQIIQLVLSTALKLLPGITSSKVQSKMNSGRWPPKLDHSITHTVHIVVPTVLRIAVCWAIYLQSHGRFQLSVTELNGFVGKAYFSPSSPFKLRNRRTFVKLQTPILRVHRLPIGLGAVYTQNWCEFGLSAPTNWGWIKNLSPGSFFVDTR